MVDALKEREQPVVVSLWDRIDFVVVAARTVHGQPKECLTHRGDQVIEAIVARKLGISRFIIPNAQTVKPCPRELLCRRIRHFIPGQLFAHEDIKWLVIIDALDDVVPEAKCIRLRIVAFVGIRFRVAHEIKPVTSPFFTVVLAGKQAVDQPCVGIRGFVVDECPYIFR